MPKQDGIEGETPWAQSKKWTTIVGVDIGGTGCQGRARSTWRPGCLARGPRPTRTPQPSTPGAVAGVVGGVLAQIDVAGPVGVTPTGGRPRRQVETAANIDPSWIGINAVELFGGATGRAVGWSTTPTPPESPRCATERAGAADGVVVMVTLGTGIGSAVFVDGASVPNTELGHLPLHDGDAEDWAADSVREQDELSWEEVGSPPADLSRAGAALLWPDLIVIGGGVSRKADKFLPLIDLRTEIVPAQLHNDAGIVGAALAAPCRAGGLSPMDRSQGET